MSCHINNHSHPSDSVLEDAPLLRYELQHGAIVCLKCNNGFPSIRIARHLAEQHQLSVRLYRSILQSLQRETLAQDWKDLTRPSDESAPIEGLQIRTGHVCTVCGHKTTSDKIASSHSKCGGQVHRVHLQCWNRSSASAFWIVTIPPPLPEPTHSTAVNNPSPSPAGSLHSQAFSF
jgi:Orsellinic acid/F9775 biosynthesis cluster protein D